MRTMRYRAGLLQVCQRQLLTTFAFQPSGKEVRERGGDATPHFLKGIPWKKHTSLQLTSHGPEPGHMATHVYTSEPS